ncbi:MAG: GGDEF domain-containing protein [Desulfosalsimonadaceae bacterium]
MGFQRQRINRRVIEDLKTRSTVGMYFYIAVTLAVLSVDGFYRRHSTFSLVFLCVMSLVSIFRILHSHLFDRLEKIHRKGNYCAFFASVYATALAWGSGFVYFMLLPGELFSKMIMLASTVGLDSGGVVAFIPSRRTSIGYNLLTLCPAGLILLYQGIHLPIAFLIFLYAAYMTLVAYRGNREYWDALENEHLLKIQSQEIEKISRTDILTGLYNRRYFDEIFTLHWKQAARNGTRLAVIISDIDHFKHINDTYGHLAGDEFLKQTARVFSRIFKRDTDFIARYGGEEFVVLLTGLTEREAAGFAEKTRRETEQMEVIFQNQSIRASMSLGLSCCVPTFEESRDMLLEKADKALYRAKNNGRNQVVTSSG